MRIQIRVDVSSRVIGACNDPHALSSMDSESHVVGLMGKEEIACHFALFNERVAITLGEILITWLPIVESRIRIPISLTDTRNKTSLLCIDEYPGES